MGSQLLQGIDLFSSMLNTDILAGIGKSTAQSDKSPSALCPTENTGTEDTVALGQDHDIGTAFDAITYQSKMEQVSLAVQFQQVAAQAAEKSNASTQDSTSTQNTLTGNQAQQLAFSFYNETRKEEQVLFQQRTGAVADKLTGSTQQTYIEISQSISAKVHFSLDISSEVLQSFAGASEKLTNDNTTTTDTNTNTDTGNAVDASANTSTKNLSFGNFLKIINDALGLDDDSFNQLFEGLNHYTSSGDTFKKSFDKFINDLFKAMYETFNDSKKNSLSSSSGETAASYQLHFEFDLEFQFSQSIQVASTEVMQSDPITLDLDGDGIELSSYKNGARFDITGEGKEVTTAFVTGGDAFLAIDLNNDGIINSGKELFGDQNAAANGYKELAQYDSNHDGLINADDTDFDKLLLFRDDGDGKTEEGELISLADAGIAELNVGYKDVMQAAAGGNQIKQVSTYKRANGQTGNTADAILNYIA